MANVHMIFDEAVQLGPMPCVDDAIVLGRGFGIRLQLYYQSIAQLKKCFPGGQDQTVLANVTQVFFGVNDMTAEYISNRLGDQTIIAESGGSGSSQSRPSTSMSSADNSTVSTSTNKNWQQLGRKLLKPEEILTLNQRIAITFVAGLPPICTVLRRYYEGGETAPRYRGLFTLIQSICFLAAGTFCLWGSSLLLERIAHVGSIQGNRGRNQAIGNARPNGAGERTFQRPRIRTLRPGPIHPLDSTAGKGSTGAARKGTRNGRP